MFKKYFDRFMQATTENEVLEIFSEADMDYQKDKMGWQDLERLNTLANKLLSLVR